MLWIEFNNVEKFVKVLVVLGIDIVERIINVNNLIFFNGMLCIIFVKKYYKILN